MTITKSGDIWHGEDLSDLADYLRAFEAGGYPVAQIRESICQPCGGRAFRVWLDDEQGCAARECAACGAQACLADSAEYWDDADPVDCECPCGGGTFAAALGYSLLAGGDVRWISLGLRCLTDGRLGVYTDWKIDYSPTGQLLTQA